MRRQDMFNGTDAEFKKRLKECVEKENYPIYRIRRTSGSPGLPNQAHHADIQAKHWKTALALAKAGKIEEKWRWIDTWDTAKENYTEYEFLYRVD